MIRTMKNNPPAAPQPDTPGTSTGTMLSMSPSRP